VTACPHSLQELRRHGGRRAAARARPGRARAPERSGGAPAARAALLGPRRAADCRAGAPAWRPRVPSAVCGCSALDAVVALLKSFGAAVLICGSAGQVSVSALRSCEAAGHACVPACSRKRAPACQHASTLKAAQGSISMHVYGQKPVNTQETHALWQSIVVMTLSTNDNGRGCVGMARRRSGTPTSLCLWRSSSACRAPRIAAWRAGAEARVKVCTCW